MTAEEIRNKSNALWLTITAVNKELTVPDMLLLALTQLIAENTAQLAEINEKLHAIAETYVLSGGKL